LISSVLLTYRLSYSSYSNSPATRIATRFSFPWRCASLVIWQAHILLRLNFNNPAFPSFCKKARPAETALPCRLQHGQATSLHRCFKATNYDLLYITIMQWSPRAQVNSCLVRRTPCFSRRDNALNPNRLLTASSFLDSI